MTPRLQPGTRLVVATHNPGKLREMDDLLRPFGLDAVSAGSLGLAEPVENAPDFAGNARIKARAASAATGLVALADDSGFCVASLGGAPGVLSARWAGPEKDFAGAMRRVYHEAAALPDRRAWFISALCLAWPDGTTATFLGRIAGEWVWPPRGDRGFGYDPMFVPTGARSTYGEFDPVDKHRTSHRAMAMRQLQAHLPASCFQDPSSRPSTGNPMEGSG